MENRAHALVAGLFVLCLGVALVFTGIWLGGTQIAEDRYVLHTRGNVSGLNVQAPVRFRGVNVGKVGTIRFDPQDPRVILVEIAVRSGTPLTTGTFAELGSQGVTGLSYVQLNDDGYSADLRNPLDPVQSRIELRPSFIERIAGSGEQFLARIDKVAGRLDAWLDETNRQQVQRTLAVLESAAQGVAGLTSELQPGVKSLPTLVDKALDSLKRADVLVGDLSTLSAAVERRLDTFDRIAASAERIDASAQELISIGVAFVGNANRDTLPRLNALLDEVARSSRSLDRLIEDLSANPSSVLFGKAALPPGPGEPGFEHGARPR